ncbi:MAG: response regulator transcription factor [Gammaproteobacteria bacterium]|nr:response regulator transcription factor [Gammaproteobacteria bacterium]NND38749.1 response regulator transcription factor [Pseudomonadales bacterium]MBT8151266.1 response regulator transcription factor [Gammaproteobacteria bacterium]NNL11131.1 response regulator transcription factor [Pseudomonadales bacterium]NNM12213.1 response regulator transcription factor [Pseudomonadales bacterium]
MTHRILLVDDDIELCELLEEYLQKEGLDINVAHDGLAAVEHLAQVNAAKQDYDAIVLDFMLPGMQGLDILQRLRTFSNTPVLMLTARGDDIDRIVGLEAGADDYLPKPCNPRELLARLRAVLRRTENQPTSSNSGVLSSHGIELNTGQRTSTINGEHFELTSAEFNALAALLAHQGAIVSKEELTQLALNREYTRYDRSIDVHISSIRKKLAQALPNVELIKTVRGSGYIFVNQADA